MRNYPDFMIIATGGLPKLPEMIGEAPATTGTKLITGEVEPDVRILIYDDGGAHAAMTATGIAGGAGATRSYRSRRTSARSITSR